jgi:drug/metabolite transporter (DMT)-like permease
MIYLILVSLIWAFSFGLIGNKLGGLPPAWLGWVRLAISSLVFLPFVRRVPWKNGVALFVIGMIQFGLMYWAYLSSYAYLQSHEVALFTISTPLLVAVLADVCGLRFHPRHFLAAGLAVGGAAIILWKGVSTANPLIGFLFVQISNLCFAVGQLAYRAVMRRLPTPIPDHRVFFWLHLGGFAALTPVALPLQLGAAPPSPTSTQWAILIYLGLIASGLGFFWWNKGARRVGTGALAVMNNVKIPLSVAVSLWIFKETAGLPSLLAGGLLIGIALLPVRKAKD